MAAVHDTTPLKKLAGPLCQAAAEPVRRRGSATPASAAGASARPSAAVEERQALAAKPAAAISGGAARPRRVRTLNPLAAADAALLEAVSWHEFLINGLRKRDLRRLLSGTQATSAAEGRQRSAAVTRQVRLLRGHGLLQKVPKTHRYLISAAGRKPITALLAARKANAEELTRCAAEQFAHGAK